MERTNVMGLKLNARLEAGRQALGIVGRSVCADFKEAFNNFEQAYGFLKEEFEAALSTSDVADPPSDSPNAEPNV